MIKFLRALLDRVNNWRDIGQLILRVSIGVIFLHSGYGKLHNLDGFIEFFAKLGIPMPELQAPAIATLELVGGAALIFGLATRFFALNFVGVMVVASVTAIIPELEEKIEYLNSIEFIYLMIFIYLTTNGAGRWSIDQLVFRRLAKT